MSVSPLTSSLHSTHEVRGVWKRTQVSSTCLTSCEAWQQFSLLVTPKPALNPSCMRITRLIRPWHTPPATVYIFMLLSDWLSHSALDYMFRCRCRSLYGVSSSNEPP